MAGHGWIAVLITTLACHQAGIESQTQLQTQSLTCDAPASRDTVPPPPRATNQPMSAAQRDAIVAQVRAHRDAWLARRINHYRVRVSVGCFCPWPQAERVLEVRDGKAVALFDTLGHRAGELREPWSTQTIEAAFDNVEQTARRVDVLAVRYDACLGFVAETRGDSKLGLPDDWFWTRVSHLQVLR